MGILVDFAQLNEHYSGHAASAVQGVVSRLSNTTKASKRLALAIGSLIFLALTFHWNYTSISLPRPYGRIESSTYGLQAPAPHTSTRSFLPWDEAEKLCKAQQFEVFPERDHHRKIYDLFLIGTELDWMEIRLGELAHIVDYFVVVESPRTFTNHKKPLHLKDNFHLFEKYASQIIYRQVDMPGMEENSTWEREAYLRNSLYDAVFPSLVGPQAPSLGDIILVSDTDELPRPETMTMLRNCQFPDRVTLRARFFYYSFQWEKDGNDWNHPQATFYQGPSTIRPEGLRMGPGWDVINASWHCSSCFKTVSEMKHKIESFSHTEYDQEDFKDPAQIVRRVRNGLDLFDRDGQNYKKIPTHYDLPQFIEDNSDRYAYMVDRDPLNANFRDFP